MEVCGKGPSTSFDFFHGPVAEVFREDLSHISFLREELNHFCARGMSWKETEQVKWKAKVNPRKTGRSYRAVRKQLVLPGARLPCRSELSF